MTQPTLLCYDKNGVLSMIVHDAQNAADPAWNLPKGVTVPIDRAAYNKLSSHYEIHKAIVDVVKQIDPVVGSAVQASIDKADADAAANAKAIADAQAKYDTFVAALTAPQQDAFKALATPQDLTAFVTSLTPAQKSLAPFDTTAIVAEVGAIDAISL